MYLHSQFIELKKSQSLQEKQTLNSNKWIIEWESVLQKSEGSEHLVTIHGTHWNSPEG